MHHFSYKFKFGNHATLIASIFTALLVFSTLAMADPPNKPSTPTIELLEKIPPTEEAIAPKPELVLKEIDNSSASNIVATPQTEAVSPTQLIAISDRKQRLLASPDRQGYGASATGGSNYIEVRTFTELKNALETENSYVIISADLANKTIPFETNIRPANNTTLDGSEAPGVTLHPDYRAGYPKDRAMFQISSSSNTGNMIFHRIKLDGKRSSSYDSSDPSYGVNGFFFRKGTEYWLDHVELVNFWDDTVSFGRQADHITFSNVKVHKAAKGILLFYPDSSSHGNGHVSIVSCELSADGRNPYNTGGEFVHIWNSYIHDWDWLGNAVGYAGTNSTTRSVPARTATENVVYENGENGEAEVAYTKPDNKVRVNGWMYSSGSIYNDTRRKDTPNMIISNHSSKGPGSPFVPYNYGLIDSSKVKDHVLANVGATGGL